MHKGDAKSLVYSAQGPFVTTRRKYEGLVDF